MIPHAMVIKPLRGGVGASTVFFALENMSQDVFKVLEKALNAGSCLDMT